MNLFAAFAAHRFRAPPPAPLAPFHAIGDVHGRADLLEALLQRLRAAPTEGPLVILGDMIDRGPDSAQVLRLLHGMAVSDLVCLLGNHEQMMLDFLEAPDQRAERWLRNGGLNTLESFDVAPPEMAVPGSAARCAGELRQALGPILPWLQARPVIWRSGNVVAAHAGLDPNRAPESQERHDLIWGHPRFAKRPRRDGLWVVHGHVVQPEPLSHEGRIALDTGSWFTGRLSAARIGAGTVEFVTEG